MFHVEHSGARREEAFPLGDCLTIVFHVEQDASLGS